MRYTFRTMALAVQDTDRCAVCRRHFLQGEAIRLYREPSSRDLARVCPLCTQQATKRGWELSEATRAHPLEIHGDPARAEAARTRDRLVERLQDQVDDSHREASSLRRALEDAESRAAELEAARNRVRALERTVRERDERQRRSDQEAGRAGSEVERLTAALAQAEMRARQLERTERRLRDVEAELAEAREEAARILRARAREADERSLRALAAEAFNRSPHAADVRGLAELRGEPSARLGVEGTAVPRTVRVTFSWTDAWREYRVLADLVERSVVVEPDGRDESLTSLPRARRAGNAAWTPTNGLIADP
jgi:hypothetical protein